jgi:hypothetical protein
MSLDWNAEPMKARLGQERWDKVTTSPWICDDGCTQWHPVTNAIVWHMFNVGIRAITEENAEKLAERIGMIELTGDPSLAFRRDDLLITCPITLEDIKNHIGLSTNVSTLTDAQFAKKFFSRMAEKVRTGAWQMESAHDKIAAQFEYLQRQTAEKE